MSKAGIEDESSILSVYGYVADDDDILRAYRSLGMIHIIELNATNVICLVMGIILIVS